MRDRTHRGGDDFQTTSLMADISLNSLGLILIVFLIQMIMFCQAAGQRAVAGQEQPQHAAEDRHIAENQALKQRVRELQSRLETQAQDSSVSGLWSFRIHVTKLVDCRGVEESADFTVTYFVWLQIDGGTVRGSLFGVKEHGGRELGSATHAKISGTYRGQELDIKFVFTGFAAGSSEILTVRKQGEEFVGELKAGECLVGTARDYAGPARGNRLTESVFSSD